MEIGRWFLTGCTIGVLLGSILLLFRTLYLTLFRHREMVLYFGTHRRWRVLSVSWLVPLIAFVVSFRLLELTMPSTASWDSGVYAIVGCIIGLAVTIVVMLLVGVAPTVPNLRPVDTAHQSSWVR